MLSRFSHVRLFVAPWTVACQVPLPVEFSRQEYWSGWHFLLQGIVPTQGSNPCLPHCWQIPYHLSHQGNQNLHILLGTANKHISISRNWNFHCKKIYKLKVLFFKKRLAPCISPQGPQLLTSHLLFEVIWEGLRVTLLQGRSPCGSLPAKQDPLAFPSGFVWSKLWFFQ